MRKLVLLLLCILPGLVLYAQKPAPKNPKDPDIVLDDDVDTDKSVPDTNRIYTAVEISPEFPGGMERFSAYIAKNTRYPESAKKKHIEGRVFITFVVERDGALSDIKVVRNLADDLDAEAVKLLKASPKWKPGIQHGYPVRVQYTLPIHFKLPG